MIGKAQEFTRVWAWRGLLKMTQSPSTCSLGGLLLSSGNFYCLLYLLLDMKEQVWTTISVDSMHKSPYVVAKAGPLPSSLFPSGLQPHEQTAVCLVSSPQTTRPSGSLASFLSYFNFSLRDTRKSPCSPTLLWFHPSPMLEHLLSCPCHDGTEVTREGSKQTVSSMVFSALSYPNSWRGKDLILTPGRGAWSRALSKRPSVLFLPL